MLRRSALVLTLAAGLLAVPSAAQASFPWSDRVQAPASSQGCTPYSAPEVCLDIYGAGLHVDKFVVSAAFWRVTDLGDPIKGYWRVRNGRNGPIVLQSKFTTYTDDGAWHSWTFPVNKTYANPWTACGQFYDTVPGGAFSPDQPCLSIHSLAAPDEAVFEVQDFTATPLRDGAVVFETTIANLTDETWKLAVAFDVLGFDHFGPTPQQGLLTAHEITTLQFHYRAPVPGHYTVVVGAWGRSEGVSWSEWAGASTGFTIP